MKKNIGRVRNFMVSDLDVFTDIFAAALCKGQVDYVQVGNEFHFLDRIYRFYSCEQVMSFSDVEDVEVRDYDISDVSLLSISEIQGRDDSRGVVRTLDPLALSRVRNEGELIEAISGLDSPVIMNDDFPRKEAKHPVYTKQRLRDERRMANYRLRQSRVKSKGLSINYRNKT